MRVSCRKTNQSNGLENYTNKGALLKHKKMYKFEGNFHKPRRFWFLGINWKEWRPTATFPSIFKGGGVLNLFIAQKSSNIAHSKLVYLRSFKTISLQVSQVIKEYFLWSYVHPKLVQLRLVHLKLAHLKLVHLKLVHLK